MNKFKTLLEGTFSRFQGGGFLVGDIVKFKNDAMNSEWVKKQASNLLEKLKEFTECDEHIRISSVKGLRPAVSGSVQQDMQVGEFYCDIVREKAPGLFMDFITVPAEILEYQDPGINLPEIPDSQKGHDTTQIQPEQIEQLENDPSLPYDQTGVSDGDRSMSDSDHKQEHNPVPTDNFSTKVYMQGFR